MSCSSFTQDSDINVHVSWNLCPYEDFTGYVDNYIVMLDCSDVSWIYIYIYIFTVKKYK